MLPWAYIVAQLGPTQPTTSSSQMNCWLDLSLLR